jgi:tetratricopeptide (TPR) repeat protein
MVKRTWLLGGILVCSVLSDVHPAFAVGKFQKKEDAVVATQTALTQPVARSAKDKKRPDLTQGDLFAGKGAALQAVIEGKIAVLKRLIGLTSDSDPEKPDLLFRLAELNAELMRIYNFRARDLDEKIFAARTAKDNDKSKVSALEFEQQSLEKKEKEWLREAVKNYLAVANEPKFQRYARMDEVLFYLAYLLTQVNHEEQARGFFQRLIKDYPQSAFLPHAYLSFGEFFFEKRDLENALRFYEKVLSYRDSPVYGYALYKKGWVYYNLTQYKDAMAQFIDVVAFAQAPKKGARDKKGDAQLLKEARKDLVRVFAQIGAPDKAWPFFLKYGKDYAPTMMELLAELYGSQGKFAESIESYRQLVALSLKGKAFSENGKLCAWQTEILRNTLAMTGSRAVPETVKELQRLSGVSEQFAERSDVSQTARDECRDTTAGMLRELATVWHKEAQKTRIKSTYDSAAELYKEYFRRFGLKKDDYALRFYYAELLYQLGDQHKNAASPYYCEAAPIYTDVVKLDGKGAKLREAAYAAVVSWKNCLDVPEEKELDREVDNVISGKRDERREARKNKGGAVGLALVPKPIPEKQQKLLDAFDMYIQHVPDAPELVTIKYRRGYVYYQFNHLDEAMPLFKELTERHKKSELAPFAARLLIDCLAQKINAATEDTDKYLAQLEQQIERFAQMPELAKNPELATELHEKRLSIMRKRIEELEKQGQYREAGKLNLRLAELYPNNPRIAELYHNAAIDFERARLIGLAIQARDKLISLKPDDALARRAIYRLGQNFQAITEYELAASRYESFATRFPGETARPDDSDATRKVDAPTALYTATFFRRGLGQTDQSIRDAHLFVKNYGGRKQYAEQAASVFFDIGQIYEQHKDYVKLKQHLGEYLVRFGKKGGIDRQIIAEAKLGEIAWRESCTAPSGGVNGVCLEISRKHASTATAIAATQLRRSQRNGKLLACGPETKSRLTLYERKKPLVEEAVTHYDAALALWKNGAALQQLPAEIDAAARESRAATMTHYAAAALMARGDLLYEQLLQMRLPSGLRFDPRNRRETEAARRVFQTFLHDKSQKLGETQKVYQDVIQFKSAHYAIAAAARIGQLFQDFANGLYTSEVPTPPPAPAGVSGDEWAQMFRTAYCDQIADLAGPLDDKAVEGLSQCLRKSTELSWFNEWSKLCEAELNQIKPAEYPLAAEIRIQPGERSSITLDVAPVLTASNDH